MPGGSRQRRGSGGGGRMMLAAPSRATFFMSVASLNPPAHVRFIDVQRDAEAWRQADVFEAEGVGAAGGQWRRRRQCKAGWQGCAGALRPARCCSHEQEQQG